MAKKGKRLANAYDGLDREHLYPLDEAAKLVKESGRAKFDETVEIAMNLAVDPRHADQNVRGVVTLPNGTGKSVRVAVFAKGAKAEEAEAAGADIVGADDLAEHRRAVARVGKRVDGIRNKITAGRQFQVFVIEFFQQRKGPQRGRIHGITRASSRRSSDAGDLSLSSGSRNSEGPGIHAIFNRPRSRSPISRMVWADRVTRSRISWVSSKKKCASGFGIKRPLRRSNRSKPNSASRLASMALTEGWVRPSARDAAVTEPERMISRKVCN